MAGPGSPKVVAAEEGAIRIGGSGGRVQRCLPARVAGRLATDWTNQPRHVRPLPRPRRPAATRHPGPLQGRAKVMTRSVTVLATGAATTIQDAGRPGQAALGIGRSGACDRASYRLADRLLREHRG